MAYSELPSKNRPVSELSQGEGALAGHRTIASRLLIVTPRRAACFAFVLGSTALSTWCASSLRGPTAPPSPIAWAVALVASVLVAQWIARQLADEESWVDSSGRKQKSFTLAYFGMYRMIIPTLLPMAFAGIVSAWWMVRSTTSGLDVLNGLYAIGLGAALGGWLASIPFLITYRLVASPATVAQAAPSPQRTQRALLWAALWSTLWCAPSLSGSLPRSLAAAGPLLLNLLLLAAIAAWCGGRLRSPDGHVLARPSGLPMVFALALAGLDVFLVGRAVINLVQ